MLDLAAFVLPQNAVRQPRWCLVCRLGIAVMDDPPSAHHCHFGAHLVCYDQGLRFRRIRTRSITMTRDNIAGATVPLVLARHYASAS
jgi:hypothetical protein